MKKLNKLNYLMVALIAAIYGFILTSCEDVSNDDQVGETSGKISLKITDAPMDYSQFKEVSITIDKVEIRKVNKNNPDDVIVLTDKPFTVNMLNLINGLTETLAQSELPVGDYDLLRVYISSTKMILMNGKSYSNNMDYNNNHWNGGSNNWNNNDNWNNMMMNSDKGSIDIPINPYFTVQDGTNEKFLLDVDVNRSFQCRDLNYTYNGNEKWMNMSGYTFTPVMRFVQMSETGTIKGKVQSQGSGIKDATVYLMKSGKIYTSTHTDNNGNYKFIGIPKGTYTIDVEMDGYSVDTAQWNNNVQMNPGDVTNVNCNMTPDN